MEEKKAVEVEETKVVENENVISEAEQGLEKEETQSVPESSGDESEGEDTTGDDEGEKKKRRRKKKKKKRRVKRERRRECHLQKQEREEYEQGRGSQR